MNDFEKRVNEILNEASTSNLPELVDELSSLVASGDFLDKLENADFKTKKEAAKILGHAVRIIKGL